MGAESIAWNVTAWLATYALHSTALILTAWLAALALARITRLRDFAAGIREWMWKLALLGGLATATAQAGFSIELWRLDWLPTVEPITQPQRSAPERSQPAQWTFAPTVASSPAVDPLIAPALFQLQVLDAADELEAVRETATPVQTAELSAPASPDRPLPWLEIALAAWLTGIAIGLVRWGREWQRLRQCVRGRVAIESGLVFRDLETLRKRAGFTRRVRLSCAPGIAVPLTMGVLRAEICLPPRALRALQRDEIRAVLAHELAHAVRRDTAWLCLCRLLEITFFFQPLNRVARRFLQEDVESLCDDWAVVHTGECVPLASSLTEIAGWIVGEHRRLPAPAMVAHGSGLSHRVRRLLDEERAPVVLRGRLGLTAIAGLCCAGAAFALPGVATPAAPECVAALEECEGAAPGDACDELDPSEDADVLVPLADWEEALLPALTETIADPMPVSGDEPLDLSGLLDDIDALEHGLDSLQAQSSVLRTHELEPQLDALEKRFESLRAMRSRLYELLKQSPLLDQP